MKYKNFWNFTKNITILTTCEQIKSSDKKQQFTTQRQTYNGITFSDAKIG